MRYHIKNLYFFEKKIPPAQVFKDPVTLLGMLQLSVGS